VSTLNKEIYEAFQATGIDDAKAKAAAESVARYHELIQDIHVKLASINGKLTVLIALNIAMVLAAIGPYLSKLF
jgi:hypothetical protein